MNNQPNKVLGFDFEIFNDAESAVLYAGFFYTVSKTNMKWNHDLTNEETEKKWAMQKFLMDPIVVLRLCLTINLQMGKDRNIKFLKKDLVSLRYKNYI